MPDPLQPVLLRFTPVYKPYLWGGTDLPRRLGRPDAPRLDRYAESWELADHPAGMSVVEDGPYAGLTLRDLNARFGPALTGRPAPVFPILVKVLHAHDRLSVQVHPDEAAAGRRGGEPKTECWYILDAEPDAAVWAGLRPGVDAAALRRAVERDTVADLLVRRPVRPGDLLFIPGGCVHAIGAGCLILEVQQPSDTTYRVYDWNRREADGRARPLHLDEALRAIRWDESGSPPQTADPADGPVRRLLDCPYFRVDELVLRGPLESGRPGGRFQALFAISGGVRVRWPGGGDRLPRGRTGLLPASVRDCTLEPEGDAVRLLRLSGPPASGGQPNSGPAMA